jgi:cytochrome c551/c552
MKFITITAFFSFLITIGCNTSNKQEKLLTRDNLPSKQYIINVDKDTTLQTENGALLKIPQGTLKPESGNTVILEIKEAFSLSEMVKAGLVTQSGGQPLSSGGMIYINVANGQKVTITRPIQVAIPASYLQKNMQLYKSDTSADQVDWVKPVALPENKQLASMQNGQILFQNNCASCHSIDKDLTGPKLAHFPRRFKGIESGAEGLSSYWYHGLPEMSDRSDSAKKVFFHPDPYYENLELYVCNLLKQYVTRGTAFNLSQQQLVDLFNYIQNETDKMHIPFPGKEDLRNSVDSCRAYKREIARLLNKKQKIESKRTKLIDENGPLADKKADSTWLTGNFPPPPDFDKRVSPNYYDAVYYQFTIESFGWYNIDMLLKDVDGVEESELFVRVVGQYKEKIKIFLVIPSVKVYGEGGPSDKNKEEFAFFYKNGRLPLPQNAGAFILAVTETKQSIAYGIKEFTTTKQQTLDISLQTSSKTEFMDAMKAFDNDRLHIKVEDAKNGARIRKKDDQLKKINGRLKGAELLRPKNCDCECGEEPVKVS